MLKEVEEILEKTKNIPSKRIIFDVDGVVARDNDDKPYCDRTPYNHIKDLFEGLRKQGHIVILQTARYFYRSGENQEKARDMGLFELECWLKKHEIPYDGVFMGKVAGNLYVDDKGCRVDSNKGMEDWLEVFPEALKNSSKK